MLFRSDVTDRFGFHLGIRRRLQPVRQAPESSGRFPCRHSPSREGIPVITGARLRRRGHRHGGILAEVDDGSCAIPGCTGSLATNYVPYANVDDASCIYNRAVGRVASFGYLGQCEVFVDSDAEAFNLVEKNQRPLAFYWFGDQKEPRQKWLKDIVAGGVTINDCLLHCVQNDLPFGGVSYSGSGTYHGIWGFENFSHRKSIFKQSKFSAMKSVSPPYTKTKYKLLRMLRFLI